MSNTTYKVEKDRRGKKRAQLQAGNNRIIWASKKGYATEDECNQNAIKVSLLLANTKIDFYKHWLTREWRWRVWECGIVEGKSSESYKNRLDCERNAEQVQLGLSYANI